MLLRDRELEMRPGFRLFLSTRLPNPSFAPELAAKVALVDCSVGRAGLEEQLLSKLILKERQDLEHQRRVLVAEVGGRARVSRAPGALAPVRPACLPVPTTAAARGLVRRTRAREQHGRHGRHACLARRDRFGSRLHRG